MLSDYLKKQAGDPLTSSMAATSGVARDLFMVAAATAALAGIGTGYASSRLTSPKPVDVDNERKQYLLTDMKLRLAKYRKEKKLDEGLAPEPAPLKPVREIRL